ncbi:benzoate/H(+) symporter BenE family transporter [Marinomonas algicola]|uniref:benzoate/H(+) symporter BenE family transporter n=1 Tax=Marinomonas algicola TaxID=2773454 RepID=UPI001EFF429A|nr:benzoate/H(+) symporter BenE family transporter [Marinomonas algicola]
MKTMYLPKISHITSGFVAVLVGYTSSVAIIFQAALASGASSDQISSWLWALGIGMGVTSFGLSLYYKTPILTAWSTPGAALLATGLSGTSLEEAIGLFIVCSILITFCGLTGIFEKIMSYVPSTLASAMLAGVLFPFALNGFGALSTHPLLVGSMVVVFFILKKVLPNYAVPFVLIIGIAIASLQSLIAYEDVSLLISTPIWITPSFSLGSILGIGLPLFIVTMASQNVPGLAVLRSHDYQVSASPLISCTGIAGIVLAPFGGFAFNLAAITAAICMGEDADKNKASRYFASMWAGGFYILMGLFSTTVVALFSAFPQALVLAIAALALLGTIGNSLHQALNQPSERDSALLTFLITASGMSMFGIGSAFWGLIIGLCVYHFNLVKSRV